MLKLKELIEINETQSPFLARYGQLWTPKKGPKTDIFPDENFAESPVPNAQKGTFLPEVLLQKS